MEITLTEIVALMLMWVLLYGAIRLFEKFMAGDFDHFFGYHDKKKKR